MFRPEYAYNGVFPKTYQKTGGTQMVKGRKKNTREKRSRKQFKATAGRASKINASIAYDTYTEQLNPFGMLLAVIGTVCPKSQYLSLRA